MSPLWPLFPVTHLTHLALMALLAAPGGARADSAPAAARSNNSSLTESKGVLGGGDPRHCGRDQPRPAWAATTAGNLRNPKHSNHGYLFSSYADDITMSCSCNDASNLIIRDEDHQLQSEHLNSTTIQVTLIRPDVGKYIYHCTDSVTTCTHTLIVLVLPVMSVTAPHVRQTRLDYEIPDYFVPRGETYIVSCSAHEASDFTVATDTDSHDVQTNYVNSSTRYVMATVSDHTEGIRVYYCTSSNYTTAAAVRITVD